jgi:hypothetical protein
MSPWVRFCSNGVGREYEKKPDANGNLKKLPSNKIKKGFVFFGGKDFYSGYGFSKNNGNTPENIIGYVPDGKSTPHTVTNSLRESNYPIHVPSPEIERINVTIQKELYRRATIEWVCFSKAQLEYMTPYFLVPGITCILEWGWNHFNPSCLLDLTDTTALKKLNDNPYPLYTNHILESKGNYDVLFGKVTQFKWSADGNKFRCTTEITSQDRIYAGLVLDSHTVNKVKDPDTKETIDIKPFDSLIDFLEKKSSLFKSVSSNGDAGVPELKPFMDYISEHYSKVSPTKYREYAYGVFYGRDNEDKASGVDDNKKEDFDRIGSTKEMWISLGTVVEILNFHASKMKSFGKNEMFRIDIDDVVIGAHPNLISADGGVMLIPNAQAPKYFSGNYGYAAANQTPDQNGIDYSVMQNRSTGFPISTEMEARQKKYGETGNLADWRLYKLCIQQGGEAKRDNIDELINKIRYEKVGGAGEHLFAFPSMNDIDMGGGSKPYPKRYTGYLKHLYVNVNHLVSIAKSNNGTITYVQLIETLMKDISDAAGDFWDFRLVSGTGKRGQDPSDPATMKIVDYKFMHTLNTGMPFTFDYFDSDSLLQGIGFNPTLSDAQAIRTIYAQTNRPDINTVVTNGDNELLDYKFRDRLFADDTIKTNLPVAEKNTEFRESMRYLQQLSAPKDSYQMTMRALHNNVSRIIIRRLCLPAKNVLKLLLDDGDTDNHPKYTGIMPGIQATFTIQGIGGLRTFMMFLVRNLPEPYSHENIVFRIVDVQETIEAGKWTTTITAGVIPLRGFIKDRLGIL